MNYLTFILDYKRFTDTFFVIVCVSENYNFYQLLGGWYGSNIEPSVDKSIQSVDSVDSYGLEGCNDVCLGEFESMRCKSNIDSQKMISGKIRPFIKLYFAIFD